MRIDAITNQNPNFGLKKTTKVIYRFANDIHCTSLTSDKPSLCGKVVQDTVHFENGKKLTIAKTYGKMGGLTEKLYYLRDETGKWIKSKLQCFKGNKVVQELRGQKDA